MNMTGLILKRSTMPCARKARFRKKLPCLTPPLGYCPCISSTYIHYIGNHLIRINPLVLIEKPCTPLYSWKEERKHSTIQRADQFTATTVTYCGDRGNQMARVAEIEATMISVLSIVDNSRIYPRSQQYSLLNCLYPRNA